MGQPHHAPASSSRGRPRGRPCPGTRLPPLSPGSPTSTHSGRMTARPGPASQPAGACASSVKSPNRTLPGRRRCPRGTRRPAGWRRPGSRRRTRSAAPGRPPRGVPSCAIRPPSMTASRFDISSASSWSWVTKTKVMPTSRCSAVSSARSECRSLASSAPSGSSRSSTDGSSTSARASATRCCCPPDSWWGRRWAYSVSRTSSSASRDPARPVTCCRRPCATAARTRRSSARRGAGRARSSGRPC